MHHVVIGCGEVGSALRKVLNCDGVDVKLAQFPSRASYDMMHVCVGYGPDFSELVVDYAERYSPVNIVVHSTVPIGTCELLSAHHSPIRGKHPNLEQSIRTFVKYVGGPNATEICEELIRFGINAYPCASSRDTEAGKLFDLMQFGAAIMIEKEIHLYCENHGLDFDLVYTQFNETYNEGFAKNEGKHFVRPILNHVHGPIGGHCVAQNMEHLSSPTATRIMNEHDWWTVIRFNKGDEQK